MITVTGWSYQYIDQFVTMPMVRELFAYWDDQPPVHEAAAAAWLKPRSNFSMEHDGEGRVEDIAAAIGMQGFKGNVVAKAKDMIPGFMRKQ